MNSNDMSNDMSMFRKMKERITDEVSSATNKLQNMQIIDQLASSISQQIKNDMGPNQLIPEPHLGNPSANVPVNSQFSLIDDSPVGGYNEEDELNSEISPQHQLFDEHSIKRLNPSGPRSFHLDKNNGTLPSNNHNGSVGRPQGSGIEGADNSHSVINIYELSSDIEDGLDQDSDTYNKDDRLDVEIDLLSDKPVGNDTDSLSYTRKGSDSYLPIYKTKYRELVHDLRKIHQDLETERNKSQSQRQELTNRITALKMELDNAKQQLNLNQHDSNSLATVSDNDKGGSVVGSPQLSTKSSTKLRDLEKLLAKCKESLKLKNSQIKELKESLNEVEKYKEHNEELKREMAELRESHDFWTVSIAENKRTMHQEIENKNNEMEKLGGEINDLQNKLTDSHNNVRQLKSSIQDLESRLVKTSAAHQKERESLTKELTIAKNNAIRQTQKESERNIERVKLDLEKSIEALKLEILNKDEQIIRNAQNQQQLHDKNLALASELDGFKRQLQEQLKLVEDTVKDYNLEKDRCSELKLELDNLRSSSNDKDGELHLENKELSEQVKSLELKLKSADAVKCELDRRLNELDKTKGENCENCEPLKAQLLREKEQFQQELHELNTRLNLMTTANDDQEKEIRSLTTERDTLTESHKGLTAELEELHKRNESLARVIEENETDMQSQQEQLGRLVAFENELDSLKRENASLVLQMSRYKSELDERIHELTSLRSHDEVINDQLSKLKADLETNRSVVDELTKERDSLAAQNESNSRERRDLVEQLVVRTLSAMKNLETPNTSPGSDKSYESFHQQDSDSNKEERSLPDPVALIEELSSLALDRSSAYMTASQRLQAVLLENNMICEEVKRLRDELNNLNRENSLATECSLNEMERLRTENQALIHDQQAYDERISSLEHELEKLSKRLEEKDKSADFVPNSTEFEYLKNIVYQFMLGKETLVLARVISAVFKFDQSQIEQICKIQETFQTASRQNI